MAKKFFLHTAALTGSKLAVSASQIVILPIIAAYLSVEDFGAVALAMTVVIFAQLMSDAGVGRSLIRQKEFVQAEWNTVYWFLVLVGFALMGVMLLIAPIVAKLFGVPIAESLISALSIVPFCFAIAAVPAARMERDGEFPQLALIELSAAVLGLVMAVWFAVKGAGAWALIAQHITIATVRLALVTVTSAYRYNLPIRFTNIVNHMRFGRDTVGVALMIAVQRQVPVMMVGYFLGQAALGLYAMGHRVWNIPHMALTGPFSQTAYVRMARLQDEKGAMAEVFISTTRILACLVFPPMLILAAVASDVFAFVLSEPWRFAGEIYTLAAFGVALECVISTYNPMLQAADKSFIRLKVATERSILRILALGAALPFGIKGVALAITLFACAFMIRELTYARRADVFSRRRAIFAIVPAAGVSVAAALVLYLWNLAQGDVHGLMVIGEAALVLAATWGIVLFLQFKQLKAGLGILGR